VTNPFSTDALVPSWFSVGVLKGDLPGHPFRGNQWTAGSLVDKSKELVSNRGKGGDDVGQMVNLPRLAPKLIEGHLDVANTHNELSKKAFAENKPELGNAHLEASAAHLNVARLFSRAGQPDAPAGGYTQAQGNAWFAHKLTEKAAEADGEQFVRSSEWASPTVQMGSTSPAGGDVGVSI